MVSTAKVALIVLASTLCIGATKPVPSRAQTYTVPLTSQAQVNDIRSSGGTGDPDGSGFVKLTIDPVNREVCYVFDVSDVATLLMAHIHKAPAMRNGPSVVTLFTGPGGSVGDCVMWTENRLAEIVSKPSNFYVSLYTTEFPDGALRGQLQT